MKAQQNPTYILQYLYDNETFFHHLNQKMEQIVPDATNMQHYNSCAYIIFKTKRDEMPSDNKNITTFRVSINMPLYYRCMLAFQVQPFEVFDIIIAHHFSFGWLIHVTDENEGRSR